MRSVRLAAVLGVLALAWSPAAFASLEDEQALAERYAPVLRYVEQPEECGPGEPFRPLDVDVLFGADTVALRGPWNAIDLVKIGPEASDLVRLYEYHLDYPGSALDPGCTYELWSRRISEGTSPSVYAHVVTDPGHPGQVALQYWLFYAYNEWNNLHEGDWEMIQLNFDAEDAAGALEADPSEIGYSQHEGAERADWGDDKLGLVDGHPVVYPAAGSHANFFTDALHVGSSAEQGVGCDDTRGPHAEVRPEVLTIPSDAAGAEEAFPWVTYEGRWGELQSAFFNGPTGPNMKPQWTEPIEWSDKWRDRSYAVPSGGVLGTDATGFFCTAVERGSVALATTLREPMTVFLVLGVLGFLIFFAVAKATWTPTAPMRAVRRRSWGQIISASGRMYLGEARTFLAIGVVFVPITFVIALVQALLLGGFGIDGADTTGEAAGAVLLLVFAFGTLLTLLGLALLQAATAFALVALDAGRPIGAVAAFRLALGKMRPLLVTLALAVVAWIVFTVTAILIPIAIWMVVRWLLLAQAVALEDKSALGALGRSSELVRHRWFKVGSLVGVGGALVLITGPLLGALLILLTSAPLPLLNLVAGVVYALALPFVALVTSYVYFDARARVELEEPDPAELPAEIALTA